MRYNQMTSFGIQVKSNAVNHGNTWIPLDAVAFLEARQTTNSFFKCLFFSFIIVVGFFLLLHQAYDFVGSPRFYEYMSNDPSGILYGLKEIKEGFKIELSRNQNFVELIYNLQKWLPLTAVSILTLYFWRATNYVEIASNAGSKIIVSSTSLAIIFFLENSSGVARADKLFQRLLAERDSYLKSIQRDE